MKKITFLMLCMITSGFAQLKTTGAVEFLPLLSGEVSLDNSTSTATITLNGPSDRWFALTFGSFGKPGAMNAGNDVVYYNGTTLVDATHNGQGIAPSPDAVNNWVVVSNTISSSVRTIVATRSFVGGPSDYIFNYGNTTIDLAASHADFPIMETLQYHGSNRDNKQNVSFVELSVEDYSIRAAVISPNPSNGDFTVKSKSPISSVSIYTNTGKFVKTVEAASGSDSAEVHISGLSSGVYLIELRNDTDRTWKKIIVN
jgi:hypothetical protein